MTTGLRPLGPDDQQEVEALLAQRPVENLFLAAKIAQFGMDRRRVGKIHGFERNGELTAVCLDGGTIFPAGFDPDAVPAFVKAMGPSRTAASILGPAMTALGLYVGLVERWPGAWGKVSNVRRRQPLMVLDQQPAVDADERVRVLTTKEFESYLAASVHMYTEEIGSSPFKYGGGYERYVKERLQQGDAFGIVEDGEVIFKADLGPRLGDQVQLQGVWVHPHRRGEGLSVPALSSMLRQVMVTHPVVSLYVNDFNTPAIRAYERLGFRTVGALATVHY
ncbi:GNAT family N-acetyltransferase [Tessaracoccus sp. OS52]|uniref:GNAT family N-acetyltransferase n=1 Tax=Tessaracoccus sp. OS52 TaxID=2886691 RepID=UPI001D1010D5|nr:GNAT family N-acetyltransferase [Tessaracoccus sp. OS52]MCC2593295.1 GNAT family N-acetyltransferase [Tessaracoccus sp. OS52]